MDYSSPFARMVRRIGQKAGVLRPIVRAYRKLLSLNYEAAFDEATQRRIRGGDIVWDVGANVGHYSPRFAQLAQPGGRVIAFEPSPTSLQKLKDCVANSSNIIIENVALSNQEGELSFFISPSAHSVVEGLSRASVGHDAREIKVPAVRGDSVAAKYPPNLIKIDVEGFEVEVLEGLPNTLKNSALHTVAIEVHFNTMAERGRSDGPKELTDILRAAGFAIRWTDPSHIVASR